MILHLGHRLVVALGFAYAAAVLTMLTALVVGMTYLLVEHRDRRRPQPGPPPPPPPPPPNPT